MSTCIRGGVRYKRHQWEKQPALTDVTVCARCGQIQGGVFEQRDQESPNSGIGSAVPYRTVPEVLRTDGGVQVLGRSGSGEAISDPGVPTN